MIEYEDEIEAFIRESFEANYERLRLEGAGSLSPDVRETALQQALLYWRKLRDVAEHVTDTEVRLSLPGQTTAQGRSFAIEGVVDIVREDDRTVMYDIKTHDAEFVRAHIDLYEQQLNVYAYIWQELRGEPLDEAAVIATQFPEPLKDALARMDQARIEVEINCWQPLVPIPYDRSHVDATIEQFGDVVDAIEDGQFAPRSVDDLKIRLEPTRTLFATRICRYCDARFSCASYRAYALEGGRGAESTLRQYFADAGPEADQEGWRTAAVTTARSIDVLMSDLD